MVRQSNNSAMKHYAVRLRLPHLVIRERVTSKHLVVGNPRLPITLRQYYKWFPSITNDSRVPKSQVCLTLLFFCLFEHPSLIAVVVQLPFIARPWRQAELLLSGFCCLVSSRESVGYRIIQRTSAVSSRDFCNFLSRRYIYLVPVVRYKSCFTHLFLFFIIVGSPPPPPPPHLSWITEIYLIIKTIGLSRMVFVLGTWTLII